VDGGVPHREQPARLAFHAHTCWEWNVSRLNRFGAFVRSNGWPGKRAGGYYPVHRAQKMPNLASGSSSIRSS
jgi:hypothetical protein